MYVIVLSRKMFCESVPVVLVSVVVYLASIDIDFLIFFIIAVRRQRRRVAANTNKRRMHEDRQPDVFSLSKVRKNLIFDRRADGVRTSAHKTEVVMPSSGRNKIIPSF